MLKLIKDNENSQFLFDPFRIYAVMYEPDDGYSIVYYNENREEPENYEVKLTAEEFYNQLNKGTDNV